MDQALGGGKPDPANESTESSRDLVLLIPFLSVCAAAALTFFAWRNAYITDDPRWYGTTLVVFAVLLLANAALYPFLRSLSLLRWGFITVITLVLAFVALSGIEEGTGVLWLYVFPPVVFYISNPRFGATICVLTLAVLTVTLTPAGQHVTAIHDYSLPFKLVLLNSLAFVMVFSFILDRSRRLHATRLREMAEIFEHAATHDALTELFNRREGTDRLATEYERFRRTGIPFSVILVDIDHFKNINDTLGHDTGDVVIRGVADRLVAGSRKIDSVIRWGGEEFLLILPGADKQQARGAAERMREELTATPIVAGERPLEITCSFGVAQIREGEAIQNLLQRADDRLYHAKTTGRNRIVEQRFNSGD